MTGPIILKRPIARIDLAVCYGHLDEQKPGLAHRFRVDAEATLIELARNPGLGESYPTEDPRLAGLRRFRINRFKNHLVFYLPVDGGIEIVRVLHAARDLRKIPDEDG